MHLGRTWTALVVLQVAVIVAALPAAIYHASGVFVSACAPPLRPRAI
jgi:hypothetical protein